MQTVVILTGAGISAESGLKTFRGDDGLWEGYRVEDVATPEAWKRNPEMVQEFYNIRRKTVLEAAPNKAHQALARLDPYFNTTVITQNIDDLHERAGSAHVLHLHGLITKSQSSADPNLVYDIDGWEIKMGETCEKGSQLRPHVVWFGEPVPMIEKAAGFCAQADILLVIGTSLLVYPAAGLIDFVPYDAEKYMVDPFAPPVSGHTVQVIQKKATEGVPELVDRLIASA